MADAVLEAPAAERLATKIKASHAPSTPAAPAAEEFKKTITLTFEARDEALYERITADAKEDDRGAPINILRFLRANYPTKA